jgi:hypothetical protein
MGFLQRRFKLTYILYTGQKLTYILYTGQKSSSH